jgi:uncharacterized membrane protein required for colicin V production
MVFWIAILVGVLFVWLTVRMGFYETWVLLFNIVLSMYVAIFLAPKVVELAPTPGGAASYGTALSLTVLAGGCFAVLQGLSYVFLTAQFSIPFPRIFDILLSGVLGFLAGFLALSFVALVLATTPLAENKMAAGIGLGRQSQQANISCIARCCDLIHSFAGPGSQATQAAVQRLWDNNHSQPAALKEPADTNESPAPPNSEIQTHPPARDDKSASPRTDSPTRRSLPRRTIPVE